jgi:hypothetical protein
MESAFPDCVMDSRTSIKKSYEVSSFRCVTYLELYDKARVAAARCRREMSDHRYQQMVFALTPLTIKAATTISSNMGFDEAWLTKPTSKPKAPPKPVQCQGDPPRGPPSRGDAALPLADGVPWYTPQPRPPSPWDLDPEEEPPAPAVGLGGKPAMPCPPSMFLDPGASVLPPLVPVPVPPPPAANVRALIQARLTADSFSAGRSADSDAALSQRHWLPSAAAAEHQTSPDIAASPEEVHGRFSCVCFN